MQQQQRQAQLQLEQERLEWQRERETQLTEQQVLIEENMVPPEFVQKIQPCQAIDGDEARFECTFKGDPVPTVTWFCESKPIKASNMYSIVTDLNANKSTLIIRRATLDCNAVYTVKAENVAGSAKSSANLVVEPHPLKDQTNLPGGRARQVDGSQVKLKGSASTGRTSTTNVTSTSSSTGDGHLSGKGSSESRSANISPNQFDQQDSSLSDSQGSQKVIRSVRKRRLSPDQMAALIRASPEGLIAPTFLHTIHDVTSRPGELARLDARLVGSQPMEVRWMKEGKRVRADRSHKMVLEGDLYTLLILECCQGDEGVYECVASNQVGEARCEAKLLVSEGRPSVAGSRTPELITSRGYSAAASSVSTSSATSHSTASSAKLNSTSQQKAQASPEPQTAKGRQHFGLPKHQYNPMLNQYTSATAQNQPQIPKLIKRLENQQVREGKSVTLRCQISSFPITEVHWFRQDDKPIKPSKYFRIFKDNDETYCLKILETFAEDQGEYKCVARSPNGQTYVETKATITVVPNSPK